MAFQRGAIHDFWGPTIEHGEILRERKHWLAEDAPKYLALTEHAGELLHEVKEIAIAKNTVSSDSSPSQLARFLGENLEPDYLLLKRTNGDVRLVCGCVCFPSSWALEEKIGRPIAEIHGVVPALNSNIGRPIQAFLDRLKPGVSWLRSNWGLSRSPERNQHPSRKIARLDSSVTLNQVYFRVEDQSLVALPRSNGILFGIRLRIFPLSGYEKTAEGEKLAMALETMPEQMADYKGIATARPRIVELLRT